MECPVTSNMMTIDLMISTINTFHPYQDLPVSFEKTSSFTMREFIPLSFDQKNEIQKKVPFNRKNGIQNKKTDQCTPTQTTHIHHTQQPTPLITMTTILAFIISFQLLHDSSCSCHHRQIHASRSLSISIHPSILYIHSFQHPISKSCHLINFVSLLFGAFHTFTSIHHIGPFSSHFRVKFHQKNSTSPHVMASSF